MGIGNLVYFFLGLLFREYNLLAYLKAHKAFVISVWLGILVTNSLLLYFGIIPAGGYNSVLDPLASLAAIGLLLVLQVYDPRILFLGRASYAIYLSHYFFVSFGQHVAGMLFAEPPFWVTWSILAFALAGPLVLILLLQKSFGTRSQLLFGTEGEVRGKNLTLAQPPSMNSLEESIGHVGKHG